MLRLKRIARPAIAVGLSVAMSMLAFGTAATAGAGGASSSRHFVMVIWQSDGAAEAIPTEQPVTAMAALQQVVARQARAEGRPASDGVLAAAPSSPQVMTSFGSTACNVSLAIVKVSGSTVQGFHASACTADVIWQGASMVLFRSANWTPIARGAGQRQSVFLNVQTGEGDCLPSTWQYNLTETFNVSSSVNGSRVFYPGIGPDWISC